MRKKEIVKTGILSTFGLTMIVGLNSFSPEARQSQWYAVGLDENTIGAAMPEPDEDSPCNKEFQTSLCAIEILDGSAPATVAQAESLNIDGERAHRQQ